MKMKKTALLVGMALILAGLVAPAGASATGWLHEGTPLGAEDNNTVNFKGRLLSIQTALGDIICEYHPRLTLLGPSKAELTQVNLTTKPV